MIDNKIKIGCITWWRNNYGSILQAYALQHLFRSDDSIDYKIICQYGGKIISKSNFFDKLKRDGLFSVIKKAYWKIGKKGLRKRTKSIQKFVDDYLIISKPYNENSFKELNNDFDGFVFGSDQIWNPMLVDVNSLYFGSFANDDKILVSFAPSVGVESFDELASEVRFRLSKFALISCREETGTNAINKCLGDNNCITILDPTLVVDKSVWDCFTEKPLFGFKYIFVYMLRGTKEQRQIVERIAEKWNLKIVTIPFLDSERICKYDSKFGDIKVWDVGPKEFLNYIKYSTFVFTDSYHCMLFSLIYHIPFKVFPKIGSAQLERMKHIQKKYGLNDVLINELSVNNLSFPDVVRDFNWANIDRIIQKEKETSLIFLLKCIDAFKAVL